MEKENTGAMSTEAVGIYDSQGEKAMLAFIMRKERSAGPTGESEYGCYVLEDGSAVRFEGPGGEYRDNETGDVRPQALNPAPHFDLHQPVLEQPNSGNVLDMITMKAENMARLELGLPMTKDGLLDLYEVLTTAPGAGQAVRTSMYKEEDSPGATQRKQTLEHLADRCSETAIRELPTGEYRALIDLAKEKLTQPVDGEPG